MVYGSVFDIHHYHRSFSHCKSNTNIHSFYLYSLLRTLSNAPASLWSCGSLANRGQAHNLKVVGSNPTPATNPMILLFFLDTPSSTLRLCALIVSKVYPPHLTSVSFWPEMHRVVCLVDVGGVSKTSCVGGSRKSSSRF